MSQHTLLVEMDFEKEENQDTKNLVTKTDIADLKTEVESIQSRFRELMDRIVNGGAMGATLDLKSDIKDEIKAMEERLIATLGEQMAGIEKAVTTLNDK
jgi:hypothetical protein